MGYMAIGKRVFLSGFMHSGRGLHLFRNFIHVPLLSIASLVTALQRVCLCLVNFFVRSQYFLRRAHVRVGVYRCWQCFFLCVKKKSVREKIFWVFFSFFTHKKCFSRTNFIKISRTVRRFHGHFVNFFHAWAVFCFTG